MWYLMTLALSCLIHQNCCCCCCVSVHQVQEPTKRLGCDQMGGYKPLKEHFFLEDINWETIHEQTPPKLMPYLPSTSKGGEGLRSDYSVSNPSS